MLLTCVLCLLAVGDDAAAPPLPRVAPALKDPGAAVTAYYDFREFANRDLFVPDGWSRLIRDGYPFYVEAVLTRDESVDGNRSLCFKLNGGHCAYFSPPIPASNDYLYLLQAQIKTKGLVNDRGFMLVEFLDEAKAVIGRQHLSPKIGGTTGWTVVRIGPVSSDSDRVRFVRLACLSQHGSAKDLSGQVCFDDIWLGRLPKYQVTSSAPYRLFEQSAKKTISVKVTGFDNRQGEARFALSDQDRRPIARMQAPLRTVERGEWRADWDLPALVNGFYHLDVGIYEGSQRILEEDYPVTVLREPGRVSEKFGLSLPAPPFDLDHYERLMRFSGAKRLKIPLWGEADRHPQMSRGRRDFAFFVERLTRGGHELVGVLSEPPESIRKALGRQTRTVAEVLLLPKERWSGEIESLMARHGLKINHWQLGDDGDTALVGVPDLPRTVDRIRREFEQFGRDVRLGMAWPCDQPLPRRPGGGAVDADAAPRLQFVAVTEDDRLLPDSGAAPLPRLTPDQWRAVLATDQADGRTLAPALVPASPTVDLRNRSAADGPSAAAASPADGPASALQRWATLTALPAGRYDQATRRSDLAQRLLACRMAADGVFMSRVFEPETALFGADGAPNELFTIFRTLAEHVGDAEPIGSLLLPGDIENRVLADGGRVLVALSAAKPTKVSLALGANAKRLDLFGAAAPLGAGVTHELTVGKTPLLIVDADAALLRFQLGLRFVDGAAQTTVDRHRDALLLTNDGADNIVGAVSIRFPPEWHVEPARPAISIRPGETATVPFEMAIPIDAAQGPQLVAADFELESGPARSFRTWLRYRIGSEGVAGDVTSRLLDDGRLEVELTLVNSSAAPLSLWCRLRAPGRNVLQSFVDALPAGGGATRRFYVPQGRELLGRKFRVELEEVGGVRQFAIEGVAGG